MQPSQQRGELPTEPEDERLPCLTTTQPDAATTKPAACPSSHGMQIAPSVLTRCRDVEGVHAIATSADDIYHWAYTIAVHLNSISFQTARSSQLCAYLTRQRHVNHCRGTSVQDMGVELHTALESQQEGCNLYQTTYNTTALSAVPGCDTCPSVASPAMI